MTAPCKSNVVLCGRVWLSPSRLDPKGTAATGSFLAYRIIEFPLEQAAQCVPRAARSNHGDGLFGSHHMNSTANTESKRLGIGAVLLQFMALLAIALLVNALFGPKPLWEVLSEGKSLIWQVSAGIALAIAFFTPALIAILKLDFFLSFKTLLLELTQRANFSGWNPLWFGLCAGIGEELLFRGALQPLLGIWWTGLFFTIAHSGTGGFKSMNFMKLGYATFLFLTSLMLGVVVNKVGLITAMVLHSVADAVIFFVLRRVAEASNDSSLGRISAVTERPVSDGQSS
jgi:membrane protease YdiL (CAAX protease family)